MLNYVVYKLDNDAYNSQLFNINKVYAFGSVSIQQMKNGEIQRRYPELFSNSMYCQVIYFLPTIQPSLWDNSKFY